MSSEGLPPPTSATGVVGYVPGAFDLFHIGHLTVLQRSRELCDYLVAGVVTDEVLARSKGRRPAVPLAERVELVSHVRAVDAVAIDYCGADKTAMWRSIRFDVLFKGDDWRGTAKGEALEASMAAVGARVVYLPYTRHTSSTRLRQMLSEAR